MDTKYFGHQILGHTILKTSRVYPSGLHNYRYRLTYKDLLYYVHAEQSVFNHFSGEMFLSSSKKLESANKHYIDIINQKNL